MPRLERAAIVTGVLLLVGVPTALRGWPTTVRGVLCLLAIVAGGLALVWWRSRPRLAAVAALGLFLAAGAMGSWAPDPAVALYSCAFVVLAMAWSGRAAWVAALAGAGYVAVFSVLTQETSGVAALMFTVPPFVAGTVLRLRDETAAELVLRAREIEDEQEIVTRIALQHERTRIAGELHDIVGHAVSVMVIQAAAGQRLAIADPARAREAFVAISESARQGHRDLQRLLDLLDDGTGDPITGTDLALVDELVTRAGRSGLQVSCRIEGDPVGVPAQVAHLAFRVVQESLTNALRYAPGAAVRIVIAADLTDDLRDDLPDDLAGRDLRVRVENDPGSRPAVPSGGSARGLVGLRERIQELGGQVRAGPTGNGGWTVQARIPCRPRQSATLPAHHPATLPAHHPELPAHHPATLPAPSDS